MRRSSQCRRRTPALCSDGSCGSSGQPLQTVPGLLQLPKGRKAPAAFCSRRLFVHACTAPDPSAERTVLLVGKTPPVALAAVREVVPFDEPLAQEVPPHRLRVGRDPDDIACMVISETPGVSAAFLSRPDVMTGIPIVKRHRDLCAAVPGGKQPHSVRFQLDRGILTALFSEQCLRNAYLAGAPRVEPGACRRICGHRQCRQKDRQRQHEEHAVSDRSFRLGTPFLSFIQQIMRNRRSRRSRLTNALYHAYWGSLARRTGKLRSQSDVQRELRPMRLWAYHVYIISD